MLDLKRLIVSLLDGEIHVFEDDGVTEVPGVVSAAWYNDKIFSGHGWQVTVGPIIDVVARVSDLGALHKEYEEAIQVTIWVLEKCDVNYTPERIRTELVHAIDERIFTMVNNPGGDINYINISGWSERDEPENKVLRSDILVYGYYKKERTQ